MKKLRFILMALILPFVFAMASAGGIERSTIGGVDVYQAGASPVDMPAVFVVSDRHQTMGNTAIDHHLWSPPDHSYAITDIQKRHPINRQAVFSVRERSFQSRRLFPGDDDGSYPDWVLDG